MPDVAIRISQVVSHVPVWVRQELISTDELIRFRAEETLAAMIANAVADLNRQERRPGWVPPAMSE